MQNTAGESSRKGGERFVKGSKVSPNNCLCSVAWLDRCARMRRFLDRIVWLSWPSFYEKTRGGTCCSVASPATLRTEVLPVLYDCSHHQYRCPLMSIKPLPGQMLQNGFSRKERARRRWPRKVVGHSGLYESLASCFREEELPCKPVSSSASARRVRRTSLSF